MWNLNQNINSYRIHLARLMFCIIISLSFITGLSLSIRAETKSGLELEFVPVKNNFVVGEPIIVNLVARNTSKHEISFWGGHSAPGYVFSAIDSENNSVKSYFVYSPDGWTGEEKLFRCNPDESVSEQIILNRHLQLSEPGTYLVSCRFGSRIMSSEEFDVYTTGDGRAIRSDHDMGLFQKLSITISPFDEKQVLNVTRQLAEKVADCDPEIGKDAARALGYISGSDAVISNVMDRLVNIPSDVKREVRSEVKKVIERIKNRK